MSQTETRPVAIFCRPNVMGVNVCMLWVDVVVVYVGCNCYGCICCGLMLRVCMLGLLLWVYMLWVDVMAVYVGVIVIGVYVVAIMWIGRWFSKLRGRYATS